MFCFAHAIMFSQVAASNRHALSDCTRHKVELQDISDSYEFDFKLF